MQRFKREKKKWAPYDAFRERPSLPSYRNNIEIQWFDLDMNSLVESNRYPRGASPDRAIVWL